jgi:hypothetical protein
MKSNTSNRKLVLAPFLLLVAATGACASFSNRPAAGVARPDVDVTDVSLDAFSARSVAGQVAMQVNNPSQVVMALKYVEWEMSVEGERVSGRYDLAQAISIPANGSAPIAAALEVLPVDAERVAPHLGSGDRAVGGDGSVVTENGYPIDYTLHGVLHFQTAKGEVTVGFESAGTL